MFANTIAFPKGWDTPPNQRTSINPFNPSEQSFVPPELKNVPSSVWEQARNYVSSKGSEISNLFGSASAGAYNLKNDVLTFAAANPYTTGTSSALVASAIALFAWRAFKAKEIKKIKEENDPQKKEADEVALANMEKNVTSPGGIIDQIAKEGLTPDTAKATADVGVVLRQLEKHKKTKTTKKRSTNKKSNKKRKRSTSKSKSNKKRSTRRKKH
jgi:hypothetical protein